MQDWIKENYTWIFSGIGITVISFAGLIVKRIFSRKNKKSLGGYNRNITGNGNISGNGNTVNINISAKESERQENRFDNVSWFSKQFNQILSLLNEAKGFSDKEFTVEYICTLLGFDNVENIKKYLVNNIEPNNELKEKFVNVFGVNEEWMINNQGNYPFASNIKKFGNNPMEILRSEDLFEIEEFIVIIGKYEHELNALVIRKKSETYYETYPQVYIFNSNVGNTGECRLTDFYRFMREANRIRKLHPMIYMATDEQFLSLFQGAIAPIAVKNFKVIPNFADSFLDLSDASIEHNKHFWDEELLKIQGIIKERIDNEDRIQQAEDEKIIERNMVEKKIDQGDDSKKYLPMIKQWEEYIMIDEWKNWTSWLLGSGQPRIYKENLDKLEKLNYWLLNRIWDENLKPVNDAFKNFRRVLNDFIQIFCEHIDPNYADKEMFCTEKFYHIPNWDEILYHKLLKDYDTHVGLVQDYVLELTRAANYICEMIRSSIDSSYRLNEGKLMVTFGPTAALTYITICVEYQENEKIEQPYPGKKEFKTMRKNRDKSFYYDEDE